MPPEPPLESWVSTPPVTADGFSFVNKDFFVLASDHNFYRRATPADVKSHFSRSSEEDHSAHWFEAQLRYYGLPVSKTKSVARMRLLDASNGGELVVPTEVSVLEGRLKKEWRDNDRETRKKAKEVEAKTAVGSKRKAENTAASSTTKKTKTATTVTESAPATHTAAKPKAKLIKTDVKPNTDSTETAASTQLIHIARPASRAFLPALNEKPASSALPYRRYTARCTRGGRFNAPRRPDPVTDPAPTEPPERKQTGEPSHPFIMKAPVARSPSPPAMLGLTTTLPIRAAKPKTPSYPASDI